MGYMRHHAIVVTGSDLAIANAHEAAVTTFGIDMVSPLGPELTNGIRSFFVAPDGSKEWWDTSIENDGKRDEFVSLLRSRASCDWIEVQFGDGEHDNYATRGSGGISRRNR